MGTTRLMNAIIFLLVWHGIGLLFIPIMTIIRKKMNRERTQTILDEILTCLKFGPLLIPTVIIGYIDIKDKERNEKDIKEKYDRKISSILGKRNSRWEILDL